MADGAEPKTEQEEGSLLAWLDNRVGWMRSRGVRKLRQGDFELELDPEFVPASPEAHARRELTVEELKAKNREKKRQRYLPELGFLPTDELLDRLP